MLISRAYVHYSPSFPTYTISNQQYFSVPSKKTNKVTISNDDIKAWDKYISGYVKKFMKERGSKITFHKDGTITDMSCGARGDTFDDIVQELRISVFLALTDFHNSDDINKDQTAWVKNALKCKLSCIDRQNFTDKTGGYASFEDAGEIFDGVRETFPKEIKI